MREEIASRVEQAIRGQVFPGCVVGIVKRDGERSVSPFGALTYEKDAPEVREDTIYDVASITKSIPTASLALQLIEAGKLKLPDLVVWYIPELKNDRGATIEDLLRYRVYGPQFSMLKDKTPEEMTAHIFACGFEGPAGESRYTNLPAFLLGLIVERVAGKPLDVLAQKHFFDSLNMSHTTFFPERNSAIYRTIAPTEIVEGEEVRGVVHDESARVFAKVGKAVGHAGLFSTAPDLLNFLEAFLAGKLPYIVEGAEKGLGWHGSDPNFTNFMGQYAGSHTFGKTGFTGCSIACDIERGIAFVILSNRTYPKRPSDTNAINGFRRNVADIILGDRSVL